MTIGRKYFIYDVFTQDRLAGNPLAVVVDSKGLDSAAMQAIARQFNLSETAFVLPPDNPKHKARVRIFTPDYEMPFAGHPTVGTAIALSEMGQSSDLAGIFVLEENIGLVRCAVDKVGSGLFAEFDLPKLPQQLPLSADAEAIGAALGLGPHEIGFENHRVSLWSAGVPYITVPVADIKAASRVRFNNEAWFEFSPKKSESAVASAYVYCRETIDHTSAFHARMIVPGSPSYEDPATGSAAAAFAGAIMLFDKPTDGGQRFWIEQGIEMGRPSRIRLELDVSGGNLVAARIGGHAVRTAEGVLLV
ncbi:PhzF family phenazine biosynthesis protein [Aminobacter sp. P9b]|uniref:Trans-2,3-dihydro-3-hydroxyanthranilate isomerase n=1 Tax=Aminobacter niigataensis TaxID=83265 RepID=A0ABR6KW89_9HYPH|nr:PhzF family phenazine biosynthesis protein [Aminobacter niigataensis]MBB4648789.1 trans-2,3-dihydro-3-hydroxyanthranilate isomerase [Aminobacter niigataensis]CAI2934073.1 Phenazine biosynthesis protein PhzF [Aminobacter niigataensis]